MSLGFFLGVCMYLFACFLNWTQFSSPICGMARLFLVEVRGGPKEGDTRVERVALAYLEWTRNSFHGSRAKGEN